MRKEALIFVLSAVISTYTCGIIAVVGLFLFGFGWLVFGDD